MCIGNSQLINVYRHNNPVVIIFLGFSPIRTFFSEVSRASARKKHPSKVSQSSVVKVHANDKTVGDLLLCWTLDCWMVYYICVFMLP